MKTLLDKFISLPEPLIYVIIIGGSLVLLILLIARSEQPVWTMKNKKRAMRAVEKLKWTDYKTLKEIAEKSPIPEVREAAREKNQPGLAIYDAYQKQKDGVPQPKSAGDVKTEPFTLGVWKRGYLAEVTAVLPEDVRPSCADAADYRLELQHEREMVGMYTDGTSGDRVDLKGTLMHGSRIAWASSEYGSAPPAQKYWSGSGASGSAPEDPTQIIIDAVQAVRGRRRAKKLDEKFAKLRGARKRA